MDQPRQCPNCGAPLPSDAMEGMCPKCMAQVVFGEAEQHPSNSSDRSDRTPKLPDSDISIERTGMMIGRYKLLEQIGEGGFGVVYMAEQVEPVHRKVALKIIKAGMDTKEVVARFEAERQALALMDHPNIAKVLDGGTTGDSALRTPHSAIHMGRPYFVMELVRGIPITEFCDQKNLDTTERLKLFIQVCKAVQHAHQKGIIHRDLKPSNILVTLHDGEPVPKIIDFGVAKALGQQLTEKTLFTGFLHMVGTPAYMSPEQAELSGLDIDTRSDIYSLGVLLYELLTGVTPFDAETLKNAAIDEVRRIIREVEPVKPSTRLTQQRLAQRAAATGKSAIRPAGAGHSEIDQDLDWIVMQCLEKDRRRRYETANGLAMDVQRHLEDKPIVARPPSRLYELQKTVRRHRFGFAAAAGLVIVLAVGATVSTTQAVRATRAERSARMEVERSKQVSQFLKDMLKAAGPSVARGRDATLLMEVLNKTGERVQSDLEDQPEVQGDLCYTLGATFQDIGDRRSAVPMFEHAVENYHSAFGGEHINLALALGKLGRCQSFIGDVAEGASNALLSVKVARKCGDPNVLATTLLDLGCALRGNGDTSIKGAPYLREAVALRRQIRDDPVALASCLSRLADSLNKANDPEAELIAREALALSNEHLGADHPYVAADVFVLGQVLLNQRKWSEAETTLRKASALYNDLHEEDHPYHPHLLRFLAVALLNQEKLAEAEALVHEGLGHTLTRTESLDFLFLLIEILDRRGRADQIESTLGEAFGVESSSARYWELVANLHARRDDWSAAAHAFASGLALSPDDPVLMFQLTIAHLNAGQIEEYRRYSRMSLAHGQRCYELFAPANAAIAALLLPVTGADFRWACQIADESMCSQDVTSQSWGFLAKALAEYRRGRFGSASVWAERGVQSIQDPPFEPMAATWFAKAAADVSQGRLRSGRVALSRGDEILANRDDWSRFWVGLEIAKRLRGEAVRLLEGRPCVEDLSD